MRLGAVGCDWLRLGAFQCVWRGWCTATYYAAGSDQLDSPCWLPAPASEDLRVSARDAGLRITLLPPGTHWPCAAPLLHRIVGSLRMMQCTATRAVTVRRVQINPRPAHPSAFASLVPAPLPPLPTRLQPPCSHGRCVRGSLPGHLDVLVRQLYVLRLLPPLLPRLTPTRCPLSATVGQDWCTCCDCRCNCCWDAGELPPEDEDNVPRREDRPPDYSASAISPAPEGSTSPIPRPEKFEYSPAPEMSVPPRS